MNVSDERLEKLAAESLMLQDLRAEMAACPRCRGRGYFLPRFAANHFESCDDCAERARARGISVGYGQYVSVDGIDAALSRLRAIVGADAGDGR